MGGKEPSMLICTRYVVYGLCLLKVFCLVSSLVVGVWYRSRPYREEIVAIIPSATLTHSANYLIALSILALLCTSLLLLGTLNDSNFIIGVYSFVNLSLVIVTTTFIISVAIFSLMTADSSLLGDQMNNSLQTLYSSAATGSHSQSKAWDLIQVRFGCCGVTGPSDWLVSRWVKSEESNVTVNGFAFKAPFPSPCCHRPSGNSLDAFNKQEMSENDMALCYAPLPNNHVASRGCRGAVESFLRENIYLLLAVLSLVLFLLLFALVLSLILILVDWQQMRRR